MNSLESKILALNPAQRNAVRRALAHRGAAQQGLARQPVARSPLSPPQMRLWLTSQLIGASSAYNIPGVFRLAGPLCVDSLRDALEAMQARHESLRTSFGTDPDNRPFQCIGVSATPDFALLDCTASALEERIREVILQSFDLTAGPAWRARLLELGKHEHVLVLSFHHLVFDGWSLGVFARELFELYRDPPGRNGGGLPVPAHQYSDYVAWRASRPDTRAADAAYWRSALEGAPPVTGLATDKQRPQAPSYRGAIHKLVLPRALFEGIQALAAAAQTTPYAAFLGLFYTLLYRHTGQSDLVIGTPVSGRAHAHLAPLIGVFVNTLPIRTRLAPDHDFANLLAAVKNASLDAFAHQDLPFDAIVEAVNPVRTLAHHPVFQVLYTYQNALAPIDADGLEVQYMDVDCGTAKFDLSLDVYETLDGANCIFEYSTDLFSSARIATLAGHFERLARAVVARPATPLSRLRMMTDCELEQVHNAARGPRLPLPCPDAVTLFARSTARCADAVAVRDGAAVCTYRELDESANRIAHALHSRGVRQGDVVGVCLERSIRLVAAVLGVMKAGAAFVALDPSHPPSRLALLAQDAGLACVIEDGQGARLDCERLHLERDRAELERLPATAPEVPLGPEDLAYVVYTSGTTGQPKGVMVSHGNYVNAYLGWERHYRLEQLHAHLQMASFPFDVFCGDLVRALGSGKTLVICPQQLLGEPQALYTLMQDSGVDFAEFVPASFRALAEYLFDTGRRLDFMQILVVASDAWYAGEYRRYRALLGPQARLVNSYGMAEATIDSTLFEGDLADAGEGGLVPIGVPFPNVDVWIVDRNLELVPPGTTGEICVGGAGVALGYLKRPELTFDKFVPHPFSAEPGARLYRTGDLGRMRADGSIELFGRTDTQVKIRGMRIELGEIEMTLRTRAGVEDCAAVIRDDQRGQPRIVAYLAGAGSEADPAVLNDRLAQYLPAYMLPGAYVRLDSLPLSANGKLDRARLPALRDDGGAAQGFVAPRTLNEEMLATIWIEMFGVPRVSVHDSFFELGGHSLLAFQLVARIREAFRVGLVLQTLFAHPTIAGLARAISELQGTSAAYDATINALPVVEPDPASRHLPFPLTEVQQAYWLGRNEIFEFGNVTTHSYDEMGTVDIDPARFQRAWNKVVARHDMLRAEILHDGTQRILETVPEYQVAVLDLRNATPRQCEEGIQSVRAQMSHQMLDVHHWPVFDVRITLLPEAAARIHFSNDALIFDVWSFVIIIEDLVKFYLDEQAQLPMLALSFRDYVVAEEKIRASERYRRALDYWRARVAELPPAPQLPMVLDPALLKKPRFTRLHAEFDRETWARLKKKAVRAGMTTTGLMLAAYAEVLARYSSEPAFSLNLTFLNRHPMHPQVNDIVGEFTSLTLLSVDQSAGRSFAERARRVQSDLWHDLEHHDISGVQVLRDLTRAHGGATRAKMPVVFTSALVVPIPKRNSEFPIVPIYRDGVTQTSQVWLDCGVWEDDQVLLCNWDVVLELYPPGMIEEMFAAYCDLTRRLAIDDAFWNAVAPEPLPPRAALPAPALAGTLDTLFLDSLRRQPEFRAIATPQRCLSYRQLASHAAWVRSQLEPAAAGELVAVVMDKGWEQVAATLGIMNSGAAYMPVDPALPDARVAELLADGRCATLVTTPALAGRLAQLCRLRVLVLDATCLADPALLGHSRARPDGIAYVIFTSGSTGKPKGVVIEHRGAVNTLQDVNDTLGIGATDRILSVSSLSFDLSVYDFFGTLAAGATLVLPENQRRLDPSHWAELVARFGVTVWNSVPALCALLADQGERAALGWPTLRHVMLSGDWIPVTLPDRIRALAPQARVLSLGGATEASIWSIWYPVDAVDPARTSIPYGRAMRHQEVRVLDHRLEDAPDWVTGLLYIGGIGLARGYWEAPELTAAAFVTDPRTGERLYRTGDLGRRLGDGNIEFLGRQDQQVKVQGFRIELGEIEAALLRHPAVRAAVAVCQGERHAEKRLGAFYCRHPGCELDVVELRSFLLAQLPQYMVPHALRELDDLPLSANGKVDRKLLPGLDAAPEPAQARVAPRGPVEAAIAALWAELLGVTQVGVTADFFQLGGDSMCAIKLLVALRARFSCDIQLKHVFQHPTVAAQAALVCAAQQGAAPAAELVSHLTL
ncbi:non-ribosomal peptide synthetase [Massilia horti]|uniref:L-cysteine--[L-cysteinyl-carrier protein] ligase n=1 Tax=Massilia horti TaxID=2562153 RepID=A0A4Y9STX6_9BURK|nr:non-ribosomal peptide synthetase [Massilia horti]TFW28927.1 amino acid adenylation domain-containing protein [Massilia horti]